MSNFEQCATDLELYLQSQQTKNGLTTGQTTASFSQRIKTYLTETHPHHEETISRLEQEYLRDGPLTSLLADPDITEIIINGSQDIVYEKHGTLQHHSDRFLTPVSFRNFLVQLCSESKMLTTLEHPFADGRWRDFRIHIADQPCSPDGPVVCLRRTNIVPWNLERLEAQGWCDHQQYQSLKKIFAEDCNGLIIGTTGSGKTSVLNAYLQNLPEHRRVVVIEDSLELICPNTFSSRLLTRRDSQGLLPEINQQNLVQQSLRMRPDSLLMGEVRGAEAKDLLMAWAAGHTKSWSTLHADSPRQALLRLEMLIQLGAPQWNTHAVRSLILLSLKYIVVVGRSASGQRQLKSIAKLISLEEQGLLVETL